MKRIRMRSFCQNPTCQMEFAMIKTMIAAIIVIKRKLVPHRGCIREYLRTSFTVSSTPAS